MPTDPDKKKSWEPGEEPMLEPAVDPIKKRAARKPKPIIEGINSDAPEAPGAALVSPNLQSTVIEPKKLQLTDAEQLLMNPAVIKETIEQSLKETPKPNITVKKEDPRLLSKKAVERASGGGPHIFRNILLFVVALLLIVGGYELYSWYMARPSGVEPVAVSPTPTEIMSATPTPTPTDAMTATSTFPLAGGTAPTSTAPSATPTPAPAAAKTLKISSTPTGYLNVRSAPSTAGALVTQVHPGETYAYTDVQSGWYKITLTDGTQGWVTGQYITVQ